MSWACCRSKFAKASNGARGQLNERVLENSGAKHPVMTASSFITLQDRCRAIEMLVLDVDGVLTAGGITYADDRKELKTFYVRDGSGLKIWEYVGKRSAIITGRTSQLVAIRAQEIGVATVIQGAMH